MIGALVLAVPFVVFFVLLALSPAAAGAFAGSARGRFADPVVLLGIVLSGVAGAMGYRWEWAIGVGIAVGIAGCLLGYYWWFKVAGGTAADEEAVRFITWAIVLTFYGFIAGRVFRPTPKMRSRPMPDAG